MSKSFTCPKERNKCTCNSSYICQDCCNKEKIPSSRERGLRPVSSIKRGLPGPQGSQGVRGATGGAGMDGLDGPQGQTGSMGLQGPTGTFTGNVCNEFPLTYDTICQTTFTFNGAFLVPSNFTEFDEVSVNGTTYSLGSTGASFAELNSFLSSNYGIIHSPSQSTPFLTDVYIVVNPPFAITSLTISPTVYINPASTPPGHLESTEKSDDSLSLLVCGASGAGSFNCQDFVDQMVTTVTTLQQGSTGTFQTIEATTIKTDKIYLGNICILSGSGSPEGAVSAPQGSLFLREDGATGTTMYVKEADAAAMTGWFSK